MKHFLKNLLFAKVILLTIIILQPDTTFSQWTITSSGFPSGTFALNSAVQGNNIYAGVNNGILVSDNISTIWTRILSNTGYINAITFNGNYIFAGSGGNGIYISSNGGTNWITSLSSSIWSLSSSAGNVYAVVFADRVFKTTNNGELWQPVSPGGNVRCVAADEPRVYAGFYNYTSGGNGGVYVSVNSGVNWTRTFADINIYSIAFKNEYVYAGATDDTSRSGGLYFSTDYGIHWSRSMLDSISVKALCTYENYVFAGVDNSFYPGFTEYAGFWVSADRGQTWDKNNVGLPFSNSAVSSISVMDNNLYVVASDGGLWKRPVSQVIGVKNISSEIPSEFKLMQNYPNPFNPKTIINYQLSMFNFVSLKVFDVAGKEVAVLVNEKQSATGGPGTYQVEFDGSNLTSGVYFYKLTAGEFTVTKRMVLVK